MVGSDKLDNPDAPRQPAPSPRRDRLARLLEAVAIVCAAGVVFWAIDSLDTTAGRNLSYPFSGTQPR
jgi:ferric-dicitrate binding protein FerR (iron transport regulator)